jgi:hypothetical protein
MEELNLQPSLAIHRALRVAPWVYLGALLVFGSMFGEGRWPLERAVGVIAFLAALFGLLLRLVTAVVRRPIRLLMTIEMLTVISVLVLLVIVGVFATFEAYRPGSPAAAPGFGLLAAVVGTSVLYVFMFPRRPNLAQELNARQLLYGGVRTGPDHEIRHGWIWLFVVYASQALIGFAAYALESSVANGMRVVAAVIAVFVMAHALIPAMVPFIRPEGFRTLRDLQRARAGRRNGAYHSYAFRRATDWTEARPHLLKSAGFGALAAVLLYAGGTVRGLWFIAAVFAYSSYRQGLGALARAIPEACIRGIEDTGDFTLYLRSFSDDDFRFDLALTGWRRFYALPPSGGMYADTFRSSRLEEIVVRTLWRYRPVLAIAGPEASANPIGALQMPLADLTWQEEVSRKVAASQAIVSVVGGTPGAVWETRLLLGDARSRARTFFLVPQEDPAEVVKRWTSCFGSDHPAAAGTIERTIVAKPLIDGAIVAITSSERSPVAYRMALDLAEGLVAREVNRDAGG